MDTVIETLATGKKNVAPGYVMFVRSPESLELLRDPNAFTLLAFIAFRARWRSTFSVDGVEIGQALIGDHRAAGMKRGEYREAIKRLHKYRLATFVPTRNGTFARLTSSKVFNINCGLPDAPHDQQGSHHTTNAQPSHDQQPAVEPPLTKRVNSKGKNGRTETERAADVNAQAEEIYKAYPRDEAKAESIDEIKKALRIVPFEKLLELTKRYAATRPKNDRYTPHARKWFRNKRFNDDPEIWRSTNGDRDSAIGRKAERAKGEFPSNFDLKAVLLEP